MDAKDKLLTVQQASSLLGINPGTLRRWAQDNRVKALKVGTRGDWRFTKEELLKLLKVNGEKPRSNKYTKVRRFLIANANTIQKRATSIHKSYLENKTFRTEHIAKYQDNHVHIVWELAKHLKIKDLKKQTQLFKKLGETLAKNAVRDELTLEETVDGIIFLKQAIWEGLKKDGLLKDFTSEEMYDINQSVATNCDVLASQVAFAYNHHFNKVIREVHEKTKLEKDHLYSLFMQAPVPIAILKGPHHVYQLSNPVNDAVMSNKVKIGKSVRELFKDAEVQSLIGLLDKVYKTGIPYSGTEVPFTVYIPKKGKQTRYLNFTFQPLRNTNNKVERIMIIANDVTEQVAARQKIIESEEFLRKILNATSDAIVLSDKNGVITAANRAYFDLYGLTEKQVLGKSFANIFPKAKQEWAKRQYRLYFKRKIITPAVESTVIRATGEERIVESRYDFVYKNGKRFAMVSSIRDITDRKRAEEALQKSKAQIEAVFQSIKDSLVVADMQGNFILTNHALAKVGRFRAAKEVPFTMKEYKSLFQFWDLEGNEIPYKNWPLNRIFRGESISHWVLRARKADINKEFYLSFSGEPVRDKTGKQIMGVVISRDVTAEKLHERRFHTLADNIPNLAWMADANGWVFWYNSRWYEYTGTTPKQMEGWGWQSVHDPDVLPQVLKRWKKSLKTGEVFEMVYPLRGADNVFRPFLTRVIPLKENGKVVQWFGTNTDIAEQKALERQKDDFIGIASHELKTPVTSIKAFGQVLQLRFQREGDMQAAEMLIKMDTQINKLASLIEDLLDVTKIQSGKLAMTEEYYDLNELIEEIVSEMQHTAEKHTIIKKLAKTRTLYGDKERIGQVLTNLLSNAIKYSPQSKEIIVATTVDKDSVTISVQDFGVGIAADDKNKVFEQFYRVSGTRQITFPGLGLGLYVSSQIVKRHGGKIWVESEKGEGSTFFVKLPIKKAKSRTS